VIEVVNRQRRVRVPQRRVVEVAGRTLEAVGKASGSLVVAFVSGRSIRKLNDQYRNKDRPTDVLSFAASGSAAVGELFGEPDHLGDIAISVDAAMDQAARAGHSLGREIAELVIHGVLHLCGYDHETDAGEMNRLELKLRRRLLDGERALKARGRS
jgi:probable rRNA maturation factor